LRFDERAEKLNPLMLISVCVEDANRLRCTRAHGRSVARRKRTLPFRSASVGTQLQLRSLEQFCVTKDPDVLGGECPEVVKVFCDRLIAGSFLVNDHPLNLCLCEQDRAGSVKTNLAGCGEIEPAYATSPTRLTDYCATRSWRCWSPDRAEVRRERLLTPRTFIGEHT